MQGEEKYHITDPLRDKIVVRMDIRSTIGVAIPYGPKTSVFRTHPSPINDFRESRQPKSFALQTVLLMTLFWPRVLGVLFLIFLVEPCFSAMNLKVNGDDVKAGSKETVIIQVDHAGDLLSTCYRVCAGYDFTDEQCDELVEGARGLYEKERGNARTWAKSSPDMILSYR